MDRREFVWKGALAAAGIVALPGTRRVAAHGRPVGVPPAGVGSSPYGPLAPTADANGLFLPEGFSSRVIAVGGEVVGGTGFVWPPRPDGSAVRALDDGGWQLFVNSNLISVVPPGSGTTSMIEFGPDGSVRAATAVLTSLQGGSGAAVTPWGTVLVAEQDLLGERGLVWEVDVDTGASVRRAALGAFGHHAVAVDAADSRVYLTETHPNGVLYRFTPTAAGDLSAGVLEACQIDDSGSVAWLPVTDPAATTSRTRDQASAATRFPGGGGVVVLDGRLYLASHDDHSVHCIDLATQRYQLVWKGAPDTLGVEAAVLSGPDALCAWGPSGDLVVAEDGGNLELVVITSEGEVAPLVRVAEAGPLARRLTGVSFDPSGTRLYFSVQRATTPRSVGDIVPGQDVADFGGGITYEISGPFREAGIVVPPPTTVPATDAPTTVPVTEAPTTVASTVASTAAPTTLAATTVPARTGGGGSIVGLVGGAVAAGVLVGGYALVRRLRARPSDEPHDEVEEPPAPAPAPAPAPPPVTVAPAPVGSDELEQQLAAEQPSLAADDSSTEFRPLLGVEGVERPETPEGRVLYSRDQSAPAAGSSWVLSADDEDEKLATPVQWRVGDGGEQFAQSGDDDDDDDDDGDDDEDYFADVVERPDE